MVQQQVLDLEKNLLTKSCEEIQKYITIAVSIFLNSLLEKKRIFAPDSFQGCRRDVLPVTLVPKTNFTIFLDYKDDFDLNHWS